MRVTLRRLGRSPGFALGAILLVALGIGVTAALASVASAVALAPLRYRDSGSVVWIWSRRVDRDKAFFSIPNFRDTRAKNQTLGEMAGLAPLGLNLTGGGEALRLSGARVTDDALALLGARAAVGRVLVPGDDAAHIVVLGHGLWLRRFGADPAIVGRTIVLNHEPREVVGVLEPGFVLPGVPDAEALVPVDLAHDPRRDDRGANSLRVIARLRPGVTVAEASADLARITAALKREFPVENGKHVDPRVLPLRDEIVGEHGAVLGTLTGAVGLLFLMACLNLAGLLVARARGRAGEMAIRAALGATRRQLAMTLAGEAVVLGVAGGAVGFAVACWLVPLLVRLAPAGTPRLAEVTVDWRVLAGSALATVIAAVVAGAAPALLARRPDGGRGRLGALLVATQVAVAVVLLAATGTLLGRARAQADLAPGFEPRGLVSARVSLPRSRFGTPEAVARYHDRLFETLAALPDVSAVAATSALPLSGWNARVDYGIVGRPPASAQDLPAAQYRWVSAGYLGVMGIRVVRGRDLAAGDDARAPRVVVIDETMARRDFGDADPIGAHLHIGDGPLEHEAEIVGVAAAVKHTTLGESPVATMYEPLRQVPAPAIPFLIAGMNVVVRGGGGDALRQALRAVDPDVAASTVRPLDELVGDALAPARFQLRLCGAFALAALVLAALGVHALMAHEVARRRRELGIRRALGATGALLVGGVVARSVRLAVAGSAVGMAACLLARVPVAPLLDAVAILIAVAAAASLAPARRATRVDPRVMLRAE